jgi:hypothetical protein
MHSLKTALSDLVGKNVFLNLNITENRTGRSGRLTVLGDDHLEITDEGKIMYVPYSAIILLRPEK